MEATFTVPEELQSSFQRLLPHMAAGLRSDPEGLESILLYLKLGGERLARIAIDAYNQTDRLKNAEIQKQRLEEAMLAEQLDAEEDDDEEDDDEENDDEDSDSEDY